MMFDYLATFLLICYFPATILAIECLKCFQVLNLTSEEVLNITRPECIKENKVGDMCLASLITDFENKNATIILDHLPDQVLLFSNKNKVIIDTIQLWFNKNITSQSSQSINVDYTAAAEELNKIYNTMKTLKHEELRTKLRELLYTSLSYVSNLTCSNNQGQTVNCANGYCQLIYKDTSNVDRRCVPQDQGANPSGIAILKNSADAPDGEANIVYACNKAMCNGAETAEKVRQLLIEYGLLTTTTTDPSSSDSAMTTVHHTMMNFLWMVLLIMTNFLNI